VSFGDYNIYNFISADSIHDGMKSRAQLPIDILPFEHDLICQNPGGHKTIVCFTLAGNKANIIKCVSKLFI